MRHCSKAIDFFEEIDKVFFRRTAMLEKRGFYPLPFNFVYMKKRQKKILYGQLSIAHRELIH
jgi:hypothetical protein